MSVNEIDGGLFVAVLDDFVEGEMKSPLFGGGAKCTAFSSVRACFGLSSRAFTRSAPACFVHDITAKMNAATDRPSAACLINTCIMFAEML